MPRNTDKAKYNKFVQSEVKILMDTTRMSRAEAVLQVQVQHPFRGNTWKVGKVLAPSSLKGLEHTPKEPGWFGKTMKTVGPGLGTAMNLWFAWDMARAAGYMGGEQSRGRDFMSAMGALQPEWRASVENAGRMQDMRNQVGGMEDLARFSKHKGFTTEGAMQSMERELDQLIGNKTSVLSQASLLPPTTQAMVAGAVQTGAL